MHKRKNWLSALGLLAFLYAGQGLAAESADLTVEARVMDDILSITAEDNMNFGSFVFTSFTASEIILDTQGERTRSGATATELIFLGASQAGRMSVEAFGNSTLSISAPTTITLDNQDDAGTMTLKNIVFRVDGGADQNNDGNAEVPLGPAPGGGDFTAEIDVFIGGTLDITTAPPAGRYEGTLAITVDY